MNEANKCSLFLKETPQCQAPGLYAGAGFPWLKLKIIMLWHSSSQSEDDCQGWIFFQMPLYKIKFQNFFDQKNPPLQSIGFIPWMNIHPWWLDDLVTGRDPVPLSDLQQVGNGERENQDKSRVCPHPQGRAGRHGVFWNISNWVFRLW